MRDRLIEMIQNAVGGCARHWAEVIADHLLANGVVEVVRCKDCKYWVHGGHDIILNQAFGSCYGSMCEYPHEYPETHENDFCSCGERSNENA